jgi:hypothetical protein
MAIFPFSFGAGVHFPNTSSAAINFGAMKTNCTPACLFDLYSDENEHRELTRSISSNSSLVAAKVKELTDLLLAVEETAWVPNRGHPDKAACDTAHGKYKGNYGPFIGVAAAANAN